MRAFLIVLGASACSGAVSAVPVPAEPAAAPSRAPRMRASSAPSAIDAVGALSQPRVEAGWIVPGPAQLVLGSTTLQAIDERPIEVDLLDERGDDVRVGVRLDHARFAVWTTRSRKLVVLAREQHISASPSSGHARDSDPHVVLHAGAHAQPLSRKDGHTKLRYTGAVQVEGWVPDSALGDRGPAGRVVTNHRGIRRPLVVTTGAAIRTDKKWSARALAVAYVTTYVENLEELADHWYRVSYRDADVSVHGFLSKRDPPHRTIRPREPEASVALTPNTTVPADTCLYAGDEPVGFIVGDRAAYIEPSPRVGWYTLLVDTPWGPIPFEVSGPTEHALATCAGATP